MFVLLETESKSLLSFVSGVKTAAVLLCSCFSLWGQMERLLLMSAVLIARPVWLCSSSSETGMHLLARLWTVLLEMLVFQWDCYWRVSLGWIWASCWETIGGRRDRCTDWHTRSTAEQQVNTPAARSQPTTSWSHSTDLCEKRQDRLKRCFSEIVVMLSCRDEC